MRKKILLLTSTNLRSNRKQYHCNGTRITKKQYQWLRTRVEKWRRVSRGYEHGFLHTEYMVEVPKEHIENFNALMETKCHVPD